MAVTRPLGRHWEAYIGKLGLSLKPYQEELVAGLLGMPVRANITQCRQSGKTLMVAVVAAYLGIVEGYDIILTAPSREQTREMMKVIKEVLRRLDIGTIQNSRYYVTLKKGGSFERLSGDPDARVKSRHANLIIVDEKQDADHNHIMSTFWPMISWTQGSMWAVGVGGFVESFGEKFPGDYTFQCPWQDVVDHKEGYGDYVDMAREMFIPDEFEANYECKPLTAAASILLPDLLYTHKEPFGHVVVGIDLGFKDATVVTKAYTDGGSLHLFDWLELRGVPYDSQLGRIESFIGDGVRRVTFDARAAGSGLEPWLVKKGYHPYHDTAKKKEELLKKAILMSSRQSLTAEEHGRFKQDIQRVEKRWSESGLKASHSDYLSSLLYTIEASKEHKIGYHQAGSWTN